MKVERQRHMTVEVVPDRRGALRPTRWWTLPPRKAAAKARKQQEAKARKEILARSQAC